jgi:photosystem II stability/assembly factor-like uncharacterized protein
MNTHLNFDKFSTLEVQNDREKTWLVGTRGAGMILHNNSIGWVAANSGFQRAWVSEIEVTSDGGALLAQVAGDDTNDFLFQSADKGKSWRIDSSFLLSSGAPNHLAADPFDPSHVLANKGNTVIESNDAGKTWRVIEKQFYFRAYDPFTPGLVYLSRGATIFRSTQGGHKPQPGASLPEKVTRIVPDDHMPGRILVLTTNTIHESLDFSSSMRKIPFEKDRACSSCDINLTDIEPLASPASYILSDYKGIYKTVDDGKNWKRVDDAGSKVIVAANEAGTRFFAVGGVFNLKMLESTDAGETWKPVTAPDTKEQLYVSDMTDPRRGSRYYLAGNGVLEVSCDCLKPTAHQ